MSIQTAIENAQQKVANAYTAVDNKGGTLPATQDLANLPNAIGSISTGGTINSLNVTPSTSAQTITASGGVDGYSPVNVSAVTASIDSNITPNKIRNGCVILGVTGTYGEPLPILVSLSSNTSGYVIGEEFYLCGNNSNGQQGSGTSGNGTDVTTFTKRAENVAQIFGSGSTTGYLTTSGEFYLCGYNGNGQQGSGNMTDVKTFTKRAENVAQIFGSDYTTGYITTSGEFYLCGGGSSGQQGSGNTSIVKTFTKRAENVAQIFCINNTSGYLTTSGDFYLCGYNQYGQQGNGTSSFTTHVTTFTKRAENVAQIFLTYYTSGYLTTSGEFYLCGSGDYGQQGSGDTTKVTTFTKRAENVAQIFLSTNTSGYLTTSGDFYLCGSNSYGQQGNGTSGTNVLTFTKRN